MPAPLEFWLSEERGARSLLLHIQELQQLCVGKQAEVGDALAVQAILSLMKKQVECEEF